MNLIATATPSKTMTSKQVADGQALIAIIRRCIKKLEDKEPLTLEEQCVTTVFYAATAEDIGCNATQEYFASMQQEPSIQTHPIISKFIDALPTQDQINLMRVGAIFSGRNQDGTIDETRNIPEKSSRQGIKTYIVRHPLTQLIKIGKSRDPDKRIRTLSTQSGAILITLLVIDKDIESDLHKRFCEFRVCGEWFDDKKGLIELAIVEGELQRKSKGAA